MLCYCKGRNFKANHNELNFIITVQCGILVGLFALIENFMPLSYDFSRLFSNFASGRRPFAALSKSSGVFDVVSSSTSIFVTSYEPIQILNQSLTLHKFCQCLQLRLHSYPNYKTDSLRLRPCASGRKHQSLHQSRDKHDVHRLFHQNLWQYRNFIVFLHPKKHSSHLSVRYKACRLWHLRGLT